nr:MAG TPA: hypothetical protein [Caudoviricetes sp.]
MGYFNIIDSLSDKRVDEGMVSSISKNTKKDIDKLVEALLQCDIDCIPDKYIKSEKSFYNRSSFSKGFVDNVIKWTRSLKNKNPNGRKLCMNKRNSILESLSEGMLANSIKSNGTLFKAFKDLLNGDIPDNTALFVTGIDFNIRDNYKSVLKSKRRPDMSTLLSNVYRIGDTVLMIEFKYMKLPVCLLVSTGSDSFDDACVKLEKAFKSHVDKARDVISNLTFYGVVGTTYNTTGGNGTFCVGGI